MDAHTRRRFVSFPVQLPDIKALAGGVAVFAHDQAGVMLQCLQVGGFAVQPDVAGRGHQHTLVARQPARHPLRRLPALHRPKPDGAVKTFEGQVGQLLGQLQLDFDARIALLEGCQRRAQPESPEAESGGQADQARRFGLALLQFRFKRHEALQQNQRAFAHGFSLGRGADTPGGALEQALPQPGFERGEPLGHHRRRHIQGEGSGGQAATVAHRQHQFKVASIHSCL